MRSDPASPDQIAKSTSPAVVFCPTCARPLAFLATVARSVVAARWDQYECGTCGRFEFRFRSQETEPSQRG